VCVLCFLLLLVCVCVAYCIHCFSNNDIDSHQSDRKSVCDKLDCEEMAGQTGSIFTPLNESWFASSPFQDHMLKSRLWSNFVTCLYIKGHSDTLDAKVVIDYTTTTTLHPFNGLFSRTTWVSRYPKGKTSLDLNEAKRLRGFGMQWHQLDHMQTIWL